MLQVILPQASVPYSNTLKADRQALVSEGFTTMLRVSIQCISITMKGSFVVLDFGIYGLNYTATKYGEVN